MPFGEESSDLPLFLSYGEIQGRSQDAAGCFAYLENGGTSDATWMSSGHGLSRDGKLSPVYATIDQPSLHFNGAEVEHQIPGIYIDKPPSPDPIFHAQRDSTSSLSSISSEDLLSLGALLPENMRQRRFSHGSGNFPSDIMLQVEPAHVRRNSIAVSSGHPLPMLMQAHPAKHEPEAPRPLHFVMENPEFGIVSKDPAWSSGSVSRRHSIAGSPSHLYCCPWTGCGKIFNRFYNLRSHYRIHSGERPYSCNVCDASFARNHDLKRHSRIHEDTRAFVCNMCGKNFSRSDAMTRHVRLNSCTKNHGYSFVPAEFPSNM